MRWAVGRDPWLGGTRNHYRSFLVVMEIALALVLLVGVDLMLGGLRNVAAPAPNLDPAAALTFSVPLAKQRYSRAGDIGAFQEKLLRALAAQPGVESAALVTGLPCESGGPPAISVEGWNDAQAAPEAQVQSASPDYFRAMRIPLRRGRWFDSRDGAGAEPVAVISESLARRYFGGRDPVGKRVKAGLPSGPEALAASGRRGGGCPAECILPALAGFLPASRSGPATVV
jgi:putative ABC transport system permease protein